MHDEFIYLCAHLFCSLYRTKLTDKINMFLYVDARFFLVISTECYRKKLINFIHNIYFVHLAEQFCVQKIQFNLFFYIFNLKKRIV